MTKDDGLSPDGPIVRPLLRVALALAMLLHAIDARADVRRIWAVNDGEKVERDARDHPASLHNSAWDGHVVRLSGARNEVVAFQVIVDADDRGIDRLSVRLPQLVSATDRITYRAARGRSDRLRGSSYRDFHGSLHARGDAVARVMGVRTGVGGCTERPDRLETGAARAGKRATRTRWPADRGGRTREPGDLDRDLHRPRSYARTLPRDDRDPGGQDETHAADRARGFRLHASRREQHAGDAVLFERSSRALPGPQSRSRLSSARASSSRWSWCTSTTSRR